MVTGCESELYSRKIAEGVPGAFRVPVDIRVGPGCEGLLQDDLFECCLLELVTNCAEKDAKDNRIVVVLSRNDTSYTLVVEDTVVYGSDEIDKIVCRLNSRNPGRFGKRRDETPLDRDTGCLGIRMSRSYFTQRGGTLTYRKSEDNRVIARADWQK
jgi:hypothetical protein